MKRPFSTAACWWREVVLMCVLAMFPGAANAQVVVHTADTACVNSGLTFIS
jgi:hypothetical protein